MPELWAAVEQWTTAGLINGRPIMVSKTVGSALALSSGYRKLDTQKLGPVVSDQWDDILVGGLR